MIVDPDEWAHSLGFTLEWKCRTNGGPGIAYTYDTSLRLLGVLRYNEGWVLNKSPTGYELFILRDDLLSGRLSLVLNKE